MIAEVIILSGSGPRRLVSLSVVGSSRVVLIVLRFLSFVEDSTEKLQTCIRLVFSMRKI